MKIAKCQDCGREFEQHFHLSSFWDRGIYCPECRAKRNLSEMNDADRFDHEQRERTRETEEDDTASTAMGAILGSMLSHEGSTPDPISQHDTPSSFDDFQAGGGSFGGGGASSSWDSSPSSDSSPSFDDVSSSSSSTAPDPSDT